MDTLTVKFPVIRLPRKVEELPNPIEVELQDQVGTRDPEVFAREYSNNYGAWVLPNGYVAWVERWQHNEAARMMLRHGLSKSAYLKFAAIPYEEVLLEGVGAIRMVFEKGRIDVNVSRELPKKHKNFLLVMLARLLSGMRGKNLDRLLFLEDFGVQNETVSAFLTRLAPEITRIDQMLGRGGTEDPWEEGFSVYSNRKKRSRKER